MTTDVRRTIKKGDPQTEWRRTQPDITVYLPKEGQLNDGDNEHFLVFEAPQSDELLALWTQSTREAFGDNHLVIARSGDGRTWSEPQLIVGPRKGQQQLQASWGFPVVADSGRIYCFYTKEILLPSGNKSGCTMGPMGCYYSDDNGHSWQEGGDIEVPKNRYDHDEDGYSAQWIVWQRPIRDSRGRWFVGYSHWPHEGTFGYTPQGWWDGQGRGRFLRFENIDAGPAVEDLAITWLPENDEEGLTAPHRTKGHITSTACEPSVVLLPDGRLFTGLRTYEGHIWYSVSEDDGASWRTAEPMRYHDHGAMIEQPSAPCPIYPLADGRFLLVFHNNDGTLGQFSQYAEDWWVNMCSHIRRPAFIAVGYYRRDARQPLWFSEPKQLCDSDGIIVGPKETAGVVCYTSFTEWKGQRVLWYPDRKYYLLGKMITDELLADMVCPEG